MLNLVISVAVSADMADLYQFLFEKPHQNIRKRSRFEVQRMIENRSFLIARGLDGKRIVGACYIYEEETEDSFEFGGAFVHTDYRGLKLFRVLGRVAITNLFITNNPEQPLIAHVLTSNQDPRPGLRDLGFVIDQEAVAFKPAELPGLEHMEPDEAGFVYADVFVFQTENYVRLLEEEIGFPGQLSNPHGNPCNVVIRVPAWQNDKLILREALKQLQR